VHEGAQLIFAANETIDAQWKRRLLQPGGGRNGYAVATLAFYLVKSAVCRRKKCFEVVAVLRKNGDTHRQSNRNRAYAVAQAEKVAPGGGAGTFRHFERAVLSGIRQQRHELVASVPCSHIVGAEISLEQVGNFGEYCVTLKMSVGVVYEFEVVDVNDEQRQRTIRGAGSFNCGHGLFHEYTSQKQLGQFIFTRIDLWDIVLTYDSP
jgi:hypothetical protein